MQTLCRVRRGLLHGGAGFCHITECWIFATAGVLGRREPGSAVQIGVARKPPRRYRESGMNGYPTRAIVKIEGWWNTRFEASP